MAFKGRRVCAKEAKTRADRLALSICNPTILAFARGERQNISIDVIKHVLNKSMVRIFPEFTEEVEDAISKEFPTSQGKTPNAQIVPQLTVATRLDFIQSTSKVSNFLFCWRLVVR